MKKSIYCVGQKVIFDSISKGLINATVINIAADGELCLDLGKAVWQFCKPDDIRVSPVEHFIDPTSYNYHHSRFAEFQGRVITAFNGYMFAYHELARLPDNVCEKIRAFVENDAAEQAEAYAAAVERRDLASMNMAQWGRNTLNHHFPFVNPNSIDGYHNF
ncbi:hypothetical protein KASHIRA_01950 [Serratia phage vB_SmaM-Kashira]|nr:hypothetical protein [Acinetobacter phage ABPH49]URC22769.1 hypothetical protein KASHIRA_01950 [Serratia phage vB_SmaM-Kashira]